MNKHEAFTLIQALRDLHYSNGISVQSIHEQTGISKSVLYDMFEIYYEETLDDKIVRLCQRIAPQIQTFMEIETKRFAYYKLPPQEYREIYERLLKEFSFRNQDEIITLANQKLKKSDSQYRYLTSLNFMEFTAEKYGVDKASDIADLENSRHLQEYIDTLTAEALWYDDLLTRGQCFLTEDADDNPIEQYVALSAEETAHYEQLSDQLWSQIASLYEMATTTLTETEEAVAVKDEEAAKHDYNLLQNKQYQHKMDSIANAKELHRKKLQESKSNSLSVDQQKAILSVFLDKCYDANGYLLPDHFGSGIQLISKGVGYKLPSYQWATADNLEAYGIGDRLPNTDQSDSVYQFISAHKRVLFDLTYKDHIRKVMKAIRNAPPESIQNIFAYLKDEFYAGIPKSDKSRNYYKTISEYYDILSVRMPVADISAYRKEQIYRIAYDICSNSDGAYSFSNDLVDSIIFEIKMTPRNWLWTMYIYAYCFRHREIDSLLQYIEKESQISRDIETE